MSLRASSLALVSILLFACGGSDSDATDDGPAGGIDVTGGASASGGTAGTGGAGAGGTGGAAGSAGTGICNTPTTLHPPNASGPGSPTLYCPFSAVDGAPNVSCIGGSEHCCEGSKPSDLSTCRPLDTPCDSGNTDWQCADPIADCASGMKCCGSGVLVVNSDPKCSNFASKFTGTKCAASCDPVLEIVMCTSNEECAPGKKCIPFGSKGNQVGGCEK